MIEVAKVTAAGEQAWNAQALAQPVVSRVARIWLYTRPTIVLGPAQRSDPETEARAALAGFDLCGRVVGGGAVLAGPWLLGLSVVLPPDDELVLPSLPRSYRWLGELHARWLDAAGIATRLAGEPLSRGFRWACFGDLSHGELTIDDRKIVGLAQARRRNGALFAAATLVAAQPWDLLCDVLGQSPEAGRELERWTTTVSAALGRPVEPSSLVDSLAAELSGTLGIARQDRVSTARV